MSCLLNDLLLKVLHNKRVLQPFLISLVWCGGSLTDLNAHQNKSILKVCRR